MPIALTGYTEMISRVYALACDAMKTDAHKEKRPDNLVVGPLSELDSVILFRLIRNSFFFYIRCLPSAERMS